MLRTTLFAALAALLPLSVSAQCMGPGVEPLLSDSARTSLAEKVAQTPYGEGLLWRATRGDDSLTILGTVHIPWPGRDALVANVLPELQDADLLLVEATEEGMAEIQAYFGNNPDEITLPGNGTLIDTLDAETWDAVAKAARARGIPPFMAARMQPWFLAMNLAMPPCAMQAMVAGETGVDGVVMAALSPSMPIEALEDWRGTIALFREGTFDEQVDALRMSIAAPDVQDALINSLLAAYSEGRTAYSWHINSYLADLIPGLDAETLARELARLEEGLLNERNAAWIPVIEEAATRHDDIAIAFGAAHLIGEAGVLALLVEEGWQVERLD